MRQLHQITLPNNIVFGIISSTKTHKVKYANFEYAWMIGKLVEEIIKWVYASNGRMICTAQWKRKNERRINEKERVS